MYLQHLSGQECYTKYWSNYQTVTCIYLPDFLESQQKGICGIFRKEFCETALQDNCVCGTSHDFVGSYAHTISAVCFITTCFISAGINIYGMQARGSIVTMERKDFFNSYFKKKKVVLLMLGRNPFFKRSSAATFFFLLEANFYN